MPGLVAKVEACFRKQSMEFDRWRPAQVLRDRILESPDKLPEKVCNVMAKVFDTINMVFSYELLPKVVGQVREIQ